MVVSGPAYLWTRAASGEAVRSFADAFEAVREQLVLEAGANPLFAAHLEMLEDPMLRDAVEDGLAAGKSDREALDAACTEICAMFAEVDDEYLKARADDVRDVFRRLDEAVCGGPETSAQAIPDGAVLVAQELLPSDTVKIDFSRIAGILCSKGSTTSHVCIIAHSKGIPIQLGVDISGISEGDTVSVDDPLACPSQVARLARLAGLKVYVNAGSIQDIHRAIAAGADGIGLFRTEFLFMERQSLPSKEEQLALYKEALKACKGKPLTLRLLDAGADKPLPYMPVSQEDNPFLGLRGVRFLLRNPEILKTQLEAASEAAGDFPGQLRIMVPMVCTVEELRKVKEALGPVPEGLLQLGIMVETPSAVLMARELAAECDFFSAGTNDLTQYVMAADRGNASVSDLYDPMSEPVRRALALAVEAAHQAGIPIGICGETASDAKATEALIGLSFDSLSLSRL